MSLEEKFSRAAWGFSERSYANLNAFMGHRLDLILRWGALLNPGDRVLELCCGDGYLGCLLAKWGWIIGEWISRPAWSRPPANALAPRA
jgi:ubiquinone/menaquinone biosynthesis C-methylase UbiE